MRTDLRAHWRYFLYVVRHKLFVFEAGWRLGVPLWQLVVHDWTKFTPREWFPYVDFFYGKDVAASSEWRKTRLHTPGAHTAFDVAWNHHQKFTTGHIPSRRAPRPRTEAR